MAGNKYISNNGGVLTEIASVNSSQGSQDANKIVSLTSNGVLASSIVNSTITSAGSGDTGKVVALDATGKIDTSMMPVGIGADTAVISASEPLSAGNLVNIWDNSGAFKVRKADATTGGKEAHGYVLAAVESGNLATVYFEGSNTMLGSLTAGRLYLSTTPGGVTSVAPSSSGNVVQVVGYATSLTTMNFQSELPIVLA